jgi:hypothetical protein
MNEETTTGNGEETTTVPPTSVPPVQDPAQPEKGGDEPKIEANPGDTTTQ